MKHRRLQWPLNFRLYLWQQKGDKTCHYCGESITMNKSVLEHKTPLSRGGYHTIANLTFSCYGCDTEKADKTELEYRVSKFIQTILKKTIIRKKGINYE